MLALREKCGIYIPDVTSEEWDDIPRASIDVRRGFVVEDGIREARKKRFNTSNLLRVSFKKSCCQKHTLIHEYYTGQFCE